MSPSIEFIDVHKRYGAHAVLRGATFSVRRGEILGLLGPNACGKTTTLRLLAGFLAPDSGDIRLCNESTAANLPAARRRIGYLPERAPLYDALRVRDYLDFIAAAKGLAGGARRRATEQAASDFSLEGVLRKPIGALSKGYRQRVGLAQATIGDPEVLLLDEATNGLDALQMVEVRALIRRGSAGRAVVFCSHLMQEVTALCDRVVVLHEGRTVALPEGDEVPRIEMRFQGLAAAAAMELLAPLAGVSEPHAVEEEGATVFRCRAATPLVADALARAVIGRARLLALETHRMSLEDRFLLAVSGTRGARP